MPPFAHLTFTACTGSPLASHPRPVSVHLGVDGATAWSARSCFMRPGTASNLGVYLLFQVPFTLCAPGWSRGWLE